MRLTILDVAEWFGETSGGIRTYLLAKSEYVRWHEELRQVLVLPGARDEVEQDGGVTSYRLRGPRIPFRDQYRFLLATRSLGWILERERPDVIEIGSMLLAPWSVALAASGRGIPRVGFYHENVERRFAYPGGGAPAWRELTRGPLRWYLRRVDHLFDARIAASDTLADDLEDAGLTNVIRVPLGVDTAFFNPARRRHAHATRALLGLPIDTPLVAYLGRLAPEKELPLLLRAWPEIQAASDAALLVMGDGPLAPAVRRLTSDYRVHVHAFRQERDTVADTLAAADLVVTPGSIETFGLSQLEAMASGTPVVAPTAGGAGKLILRSHGGRRFEPGNPRSLARTVTELLADADLRRQLGCAGRSFAEGHHSWERVFDTLFGMYGEMGLARRPVDIRRFRVSLIRRRRRAERAYPGRSTAVARSARQGRCVRHRFARVQRVHAWRTQERDRLDVTNQATTVQWEAVFAHVRLALDERREPRALVAANSPRAPRHASVSGHVFARGSTRRADE